MGIDSDTAVIAIDGGGSSSRFVLEAGGMQHRVTLGPANVSSQFEQTVATLREGLSQLAKVADCPPDALFDAPAYLGLAGVVDAAEAERVFKTLPLTQARIEDDRRAAARGALGPDDGALAGLGTGSFFVTQLQGRQRLAGGWGSVLGDVASGYWIGHEALARTLDVYDGLIEPSDLTEDIMKRYSNRPGEIVAFSRRAVPRDFAALAPLVLEAAASDDPMAGGILKGGAYYIEDTLRRMGWQSGQRLCLLGGVASAYGPYLPLDMEASIAEPLGTALDGALDFARAMRDGES